MKRRSVLTALSLGALGMSGVASVSRALANLERRDDRTPALFVGHGSPMNAIEDNSWSRAWVEVGTRLGRPNAILCVSAHWQTKCVIWSRRWSSRGPSTIFLDSPTRCTASRLSGAPVRPALARMTAEARHEGDRLVLDHASGVSITGRGRASRKMYPRADIPVLQLSLDATREPPASSTTTWPGSSKTLRDRGVLIMGSGNIVHNLRRVARRNPDSGFDWAIEFDAKIKELIDRGDHRSVVDYPKLGQAAQLSVPTNEHYLPLLYALAVKDEKEPIVYFNDATTMGSISMRSLVIG